MLKEKVLDEFLDIFLENERKAEVDIDFWEEDNEKIEPMSKKSAFKEEIKISVTQGKKRIPKRTWVAMFLILVMIPITVWIGITYFNDRKYVFVSLVIVIYSTIPFFMIFESRKPKARELVIIATLSAIAVAGRGAFFMVPSFKPVAAIVIISAVCFGGESGFLVGAVSMIVSNMFMGQGPWSPWQMFAMGIIGFIAGILFNKGWLKASRGSLCIYGFWSVFIIYGGIMNPATLVMMSKKITWKGLLAVYISGVPVDLVHATATVIFLWIISKPMIEKLERVKVKYGLIEGEDSEMKKDEVPEKVNKIDKDNVSEKTNKDNCHDKDKKKKKNIILNIIMICAICIIVYGVWSVISLKMQYKKAGEEYEKLRETMNISSEEDILNEGIPNIDIDLHELKKENPDTVGWIYYPCLNINYPIMQDEDNAYYMKHTFSGDKNAAGSIFLDCAAREDFNDENTFLYGHNMKDGSMLGSLKDIRDDGVVEKNPSFWIYTEKGWQKYRIFSYHDAKKTDDTFKIKFDNEEEHTEFLDHIVELSEEKIDVKVSEKDKIVTLATCTSDSAVRFVVHGVQVK